MPDMSIFAAEFAMSTGVPEREKNLHAVELGWLSGKKRSRLSIADIRLIRASTRISVRVLAEKHNVHPNTIRLIRRRATWRWVDPEPRQGTWPVVRTQGATLSAEKARRLVYVKPPITTF
jgi:hypothetical protein